MEWLNKGFLYTPVRTSSSSCDIGSCPSPCVDAVWREWCITRLSSDAPLQPFVPFLLAYPHSFPFKGAKNHHNFRHLFNTFFLCWIRTTFPPNRNSHLFPASKCHMKVFSPQVFLPDKHIPQPDPRIVGKSTCMFMCWTLYWIRIKLHLLDTNLGHITWHLYCKSCMWKTK